jgi:hypothetical protein
MLVSPRVVQVEPMDQVAVEPLRLIQLLVVMVVLV